MTSAVIEHTDIPEPEREEPDWAVAWRLMNWAPVGDRPPTPQEILLAAWLLLDQGMELTEIGRRIPMLSKTQITQIRKLHHLASLPGKAGESARLLAPTARQRMLLGVSLGITRPGSDLLLLRELFSDRWW